MKIVLASQSPRRQHLLKEAGFDLEIHPADFDEISGEAKDVGEVVAFNSKGKCLEIVKTMGDENPVLGADTVVVIDGMIIGKPRDAEDAKHTLHRLSDRGHEVLTGITIAYRGRVLTKVATTKVFFKNLSDKEIDEYVATGEPLDKAGSYGIQDGAGFMIDHFEGHHDNVVGLDMATVYELLEKLGAKE